jgi:hypothetical protein
LSALERAVVAACALGLSAGLLALLTGFFAGQDRAAVAGVAAPGQAVPDLGDRLLGPGQRRPAYDSSPPTSGAHLPAAVIADQTRLSDDQVLEALSLGDVVVVYGSARPPRELVRLARALAGRFTPALAAAGQAVVLDHLPGTHGLVALAWARRLRVPGPRDRRLRAFIAYWLGRGAPATGPGP